jgi:putative endonuclease
MTLTNKAWRSRKGLHFEQLALDWLCARGLRPIQRNYRCQMGEIDLVMRDRDMLVFVEVRFRAARGYGDACASVDLRKQHKLRRSAQHFLLRNQQLASLPCRFDVLGIDSSASRLEYEWLQDAFA